MIAALLWLCVLAVLIAGAAELRAKIVADERPVCWDLSRTPCHLCAGRLTDAAYYIGGNRALCPDCFDAVHQEAA